MAEERRKGASDRRRGRAASAEQAGQKSVTSPGGSPDVQANEETRASNPNEAAAFDADQLDESIRARQQEDRGEVF
jgi:hypothetical protein